jgi:protoporphyrinogen oxidase
VQTDGPIVIVGAGISGVSFGRLLQLSGFDDFVILEAESEPGGLCRSERVGGHVLDMSGGHFLCTRYPEVYDFIFGHIPRSGFHEFGRVSKVLVEETYVDYPLEYNLWQLPQKVCDAYLSALVDAAASDGEPPTNYAEWSRRRLGKVISEQYMLPYNAKLWGVPAADLDVDWLHKVPPVDVDAIVNSCRKRRAPDGVMPSHARFFYPRSGGFQSLFDAICAPVRDKVLTGQRVTKLEHADGLWTVNGEHRAKLVVNTAPWPELVGALDGTSALLNAFSKLAAAGIVISLWEREYDHDWHWLYDPRVEVEEHRQFFIGNFALDSRGDGVYTETSTGRWPGPNGRWLNGEAPLTEHVNRYAYPIPLVGSSSAIDTVLRHFAAQGLLGLGRWGQWQYFNADVCILESMKLAASLGFAGTAPNLGTGPIGAR